MDLNRLEYNDPRCSNNSDAALYELTKRMEVPHMFKYVRSPITRQVKPAKTGNYLDANRKPLSIYDTFPILF